MISLELAERLKNVKRNWPKEKGCWISRQSDNGYRYNTYAPSLSQLLIEIEARDYVWSAHWVLLPEGSHSCEVSKIKGGYMEFPSNTFCANTPEDAAARALLWILDREGDAK